MMNFSDVRIFLCTTPTNMNYSFDRLMGRVQEVFDQDPLTGHLFLFVNRSRDRMKILFWDRDGFCSEQLPPSASPLPDRSAASVAGTSGWSETRSSS